MMGRGSIRHNNREFTAANVDRNRSGQNIVFVNEDLKQVYHEPNWQIVQKTRGRLPKSVEKSSGISPLGV